MNNSTPAPSERASVLCVEDDTDTCELLGVLFPDYDIVFAHTASEGLRLFNSRKFDLCLLDNWLPDGSGIDLCKKIRALDESVSIVFASAVGYQADIQKARDAGAQEYLVKPYEPEKLRRIVKNLIQGK